MSALISGILLMGYAVAGLHFFRFWKRTRDRLFLIFAIAFWVLSVQRVWLSLAVDRPGAAVYIYSVRLLAFILILVAIIDKNRAPTSGAR
jgi:uncharacterized membrane protein HdeD (DUF308 family)